ncbi:MAG: DUF3667 domain-containing protein [Bacteroidales bacterium]|nr:DUF3667 domain-containing protein [Bacteroidales bacterium]
MKKYLNIKERYSQFKAWREQPHQVAPMSEAEHDCATCGTHFTGNYCPRCGQASRIGRFSFKTGVLNFIDVWGLGNRNMFLTLRDLILRPGYMIRDYLKGMQMAYFPPFKMFFLLAALSLLVTHGLNIKGQNLAGDSESESMAQEVVVEDPSEKDSGVEDVVDIVNTTDEIAKRTKVIYHKAIDSIERFQKRFPNIYNLLLLMVESVFLYLFFRHSPNIPDLRYSEFFVSQVYIVNMVAIYTIVFNFFCLTKLASISFILAIIPLKQLSGFSWGRTVLKSVVALVLMLLSILVFIVLSAFVTVLLVKWLG